MYTEDVIAEHMQRFERKKAAVSSAEPHGPQEEAKAERRGEALRGPGPLWVGIKPLPALEGGSSTTVTPMVGSSRGLEPSPGGCSEECSDAGSPRADGSRADALGTGSARTPPRRSWNGEGSSSRQRGRPQVPEGVSAVGPPSRNLAHIFKS